MTQSSLRPQAFPASAPPEYSGKILIVDDELFIRSALQLYLQTLGFTVLVAESGERAIEIFEVENRLDVVILDLVMPGIQGIEVLKILKEKDASVEVIIATGCGSMGSAIEALRYGAFDYITKPIVNFDQDLLKVVEEAIENRQKSGRAGAKQGASADSDLSVKRLLVFEELAGLAAMANLRRREEPTLEQVEDLLFRDFGAQAGVVLSLPPPPREAVPVYSWGLPGSLSQRQVRWGETEVLRSIRNGSPGLFPLERLSAAGLGLSPGDLSAFSELAGLPLSLAGDPYGGLLLFFAGKLPPHLSGPLERHPFQLLCPLLARIFASSLRHTFSQTSM